MTGMLKLKYILTATLIVALQAALTSCKTQYDLLLESYDTEAKYTAAFEYFETGKYQKSAALFESLTLSVKNDAREDTVQFYMGLSNYNFGDYFTAESNFSDFLSVFPRSPFSSEARYLRIDCLYRKTYRYELDQLPTYSAISEIEEYLRIEPNSRYADLCREMLVDLNERLDRKAFEAARLYYHMEDYMAAHYAFKNVLKDDADNVYREDVLYYTALSAYKYASLSIPEKQRERYVTFEDDYYSFAGEFPESKYRKELDNLHERVQRILKKTSTETEE